MGKKFNSRRTGPNGRAVLHTIANNRGCSDKWGSLLKISKDAVDKEMKRALEYKFPPFTNIGRKDFGEKIKVPQ